MKYSIDPAPAGERIFPGYRVSLAGEEVPVRAMRVSAHPINRRWPGHQRELAQTEETGFVLLEADGPVTLEVEAARAFAEATVRPLSRGVTPVWEGRRLTLALPGPGAYTLELDGPRQALHIFIDPPEEETVDPADPAVLYFGPGVHHRDVITLASGQTLYLAPGCLLYARVEVKDAEHVRILGRGILDNSHHKEQILFPLEDSDTGMDAGNALRSHTVEMGNTRDILIRGITIRDSLVYNIALLGCTDIEISRVKILGSWRYNADGIDLHNCQHIHITDCFLRTYDDALCVKGNFGYTDLAGEADKPAYRQDCRDYLAERCVIWCDWGRALEIGAETRVEQIDHITFRDMDVIRACHMAMDVQNVDHAEIHDITFEDIRVEYDAHCERPYLQQRNGETYPEDPADDYMPELMYATVYQHPEYSGGLGRRGKNHDLFFRNIAVTAPHMPPSTFVGFDAEHETRRVFIEGLTLNGQPVTAAEDARITVGPFAREITLR